MFIYLLVKASEARDLSIFPLSRLDFFRFVLLITSFTWVSASAQLHHSAPLLTKDDLVYEGAFRVPGGGISPTTLNYGGSAIAFNPANNSLFVVGHVGGQFTAEISIPSLTISADISDLETASLIQGFSDAFGGKRRTVNPTDTNSQYTGGQLVYGNRLYMSVYSYYDGSGTQVSSHFSRPLDLSLPNDVIGPVKVGSLYPGFVSGYMTLIPEIWRDEFGGPALTGNFGLAIARQQSWGPAASVFDPADIDSGQTVPATLLVGYPANNGVLGAEWSSTNPYFNGTTSGEGIVFPEGSRSILFFGRHGTGNFCYGSGSECGDPVDPYNGVHGYPYVYQVWAYDALHLLEVANGSAEAHEVEPYAVWHFGFPLERNDTHSVGGVAYDRVNGLIYFSQVKGDHPLPIIHAFRINTNARPNAPYELNAH